MCSLLNYIRIGLLCLEVSDPRSIAFFHDPLQSLNTFLLLTSVFLVMFLRFSSSQDHYSSSTSRLVYPSSNGISAFPAFHSQYCVVHRAKDKDPLLYQSLTISLNIVRYVQVRSILKHSIIPSKLQPTHLGGLNCTFL